MATKGIDVASRSRPRIWTTKTYDTVAKQYDSLMRIFFPSGEKGRERIVERLGTGSVLDVACGTGTLLALAHEKGLKCYGIDLSRGMLSQAKLKVPGAELTAASFYKLPYPDGHFDYVVATNALSGVSIDAGRVISEMIRVNKSGGEVYVAEWPQAEEETLTERLMVMLASLNEDAPQDYLGIFRGLGYEPEVEVLSKRYHVLGITKR